MDRTYLPILLLLGFVLVNAIGMIALSHLTIRIRPTPVKDTPYESGIPPLGDARERFSVKFYMVAMLFIIFDIETVFMIPWAAYYRELSCTADRSALPAAPLSSWRRQPANTTWPASAWSGCRFRLVRRTC